MLVLSLIVDPLGHLDQHPVQLLGHAHLAAEPAGVRQPVGEVEHVELLVRGLLLDLAEVLGREDEVAGGAGQGALTCPEPINVDVIVDGDIKKVVTLLGLQRINWVYVTS